METTTNRYEGIPLEYLVDKFIFGDDYHLPVGDIQNLLYVKYNLSTDPFDAIYNKAALAGRYILDKKPWKDLFEDYCTVPPEDYNDIVFPEPDGFDENNLNTYEAFDLAERYVFGDPPQDRDKLNDEINRLSDDHFKTIDELYDLRVSIHCAIVSVIYRATHLRRKL